MKVQIRHSVFETNSSSSHSLTWSENKKSMHEYRQPTVVSFREYGWEQHLYSSIEDKISYLLTMIADHARFTYRDEHIKNESDENYYRTCKQGFEEFKELDLVQLIYDIYRDYTNRSLHITEPEWNTFYPYGYIDHQSTDTLDELFEAEDIRSAIQNYIFNDEVLVWTDNDNH